MALMVRLGLGLRLGMSFFCVASFLLGLVFWFRFRDSFRVRCGVCFVQIWSMVNIFVLFC